MHSEEIGERESYKKGKFKHTRFNGTCSLQARGKGQITIIFDEYIVKLDGLGICCNGSGQMLRSTLLGKGQGL